MVWTRAELEDQRATRHTLLELGDTRDDWHETQDGWVKKESL